MAKLLRGETLPDMPADQRRLLGELHGLWFAKEPSHNTGLHRRDLGYSFMTAQLMESGPGDTPGMSLAEATSLHPAAFGDAQAGGRQVTSEALGTPAPRRPDSTSEERWAAARAERMRREKALIQRWFRSQMADLPKLNRPATIADVEQFVEQRIRAYLARRRTSG